MDLNKFNVEKIMLEGVKIMDLKDVAEYLRSTTVTKEVQKFVLGLWNFII